MVTNIYKLYFTLPFLIIMFIQTLTADYKDGVKIGMRGYFWTEVESGGKLYSTKVSKFKVIRVEQLNSVVAVLSIGEGFSERDFKWASFIKKLLPKKTASTTKDKTRKEIFTLPSDMSVNWYVSQGDLSLQANNLKKAKKYLTF